MAIKYTLFSAACFICVVHCFSQSYSLHGYVKDQQTGEPLIGATVYLPEVPVVGVTNTYGFFSLRVAAGRHVVRVSYIGFDTWADTVRVGADTYLLAELKSSVLDEVVIQADENFTPNPAISLNKLSVEALTNVPALGGEPDVVRSLMLMPGVAGGVEGTTGLLVRGGTPDQNLILIDEVPVYNISHLFGFVSAFNSDAIKNVDLIKGGFPARYGGRLSSVLRLDLKEGNTKTYSGQASVGLINSRLMVEGPLGKQTSFLASGRASYPGLLLVPQRISFKRNYTSDSFNYWLYDFTLKVNRELPKGGKLFASYYQGMDDLSAYEGTYQSDWNKYGLRWGNRVGTVRYSRPLSPRLFLSTMLLYSRYLYGIGASNHVVDNLGHEVTHFGSDSEVEDVGAKVAMEYFPNSQHALRAGIESTLHHYTVGKISSNLDIDLRQGNPYMEALESAAYLEDEWRLSPRLVAHPGVRLSGFRTEGKQLGAVEPRMALTYSPVTHQHVSLSYTRMRQYIHLLSSYSSLVSNDIWVPATRKVKPQTASQLGLSYQSRVGAAYRLTVEGFYKHMTDLIDYRRGTNVLFEYDQNWQDLVATEGVGRVYGGELFVHKTLGDLTGWMSYTWSKNTRQFDEVNDGRTYFARYDRRHDFSITAQYPLGPQWRVAGSWVYQSGYLVTMPVGRTIDSDGFIEIIYGDRNNFRTPDYHRLDVGFTREHMVSDRIRKSFSVGAYNAYNRVNPFYIDLFNLNIDDVSTVTVSKKGILQIIPYISFTWSY